MADTPEADTAQTAAEAPAQPAPPERKKRGSRPKKAEADSKTSAAGKNGARTAAKAAEAPAPSARATRKVYSGKERAQKLAQIEKSIGGGASIKAAVGQAGVSEQTYYHWKRVAAPAPESGELRDLLALEEENKRLKGLLAERLRKENAELKKKLGLA